MTEIKVGDKVTFRSNKAQDISRLKVNIPAGSILTGTVERINRVTIRVGVGHQSAPNGYRAYYILPKDIIEQ